MSETEFNPYAPPQAAKLISDSTPEAIRRAHISHETSIKTAGLLYALLGGLMLLPVLIGMLEALAGVPKAGRYDSLSLVLLLAVFVLFLGAGMRRLRPWARVPMAIVSGLVAAISIFTVLAPLLNLYVLWLLLSPKGKTVFSPSYQDIIALTPEVRPKHSVITLFLVALLVLFVIAVLAALLVPLYSSR